MESIKGIRITVIMREHDDEYNVFADLDPHNDGCNAIVARDDNGNPVELPEDLKKQILKFAGYDVE